MDGLSTKVRELLKIFRRHVNDNASFVYFDNALGFEELSMSVFGRTAQSLLASDGGAGPCYNCLVVMLQVAEEKEKQGLLTYHSAIPAKTRQGCRRASW